MTSNFEDKASGFGDYLVAELRAQIAALRFDHELQSLIAKQHLEMPEADESEGDPQLLLLQEGADPADDDEPQIPGSLYGW